VLDIGFTKLAIIGGIALVFIGPERLPGVARTVGTLLGRARRYVADVKEEVNRSMELEELRKMRDQVDEAARNFEASVQTQASEFTSAINLADQDGKTDQTDHTDNTIGAPAQDYPVYRQPRKKWRLKQGNTPRWYKVRQGVRMHAQSGAARVARFRPPKI